MSNKKIKIIILGILMLFLLAVLVFAIKTNDRNAENNNIDGKGVENNKDSGVGKNKNNENNEEKVMDEIMIKNFEELKNAHPEFSTEQLEFYYKIADRVTTGGEKEVFKCLEREDKKYCVASVAFIKGDKNLCYIHGDEDESEESIKRCVNNVLQKNAAKEIDKCKSLDGDDFFNCARNLFSAYKKQDDCENLLLDKEAKIICKDVLNYEEAYYLKYDRTLCAKVVSEKLNQYCLKNIIDKFQDSDNDGLFDLDEINKYHTDPNNPDTDNDGYQDGEEVEKGYNPLGEGRLKK